MGWHCSIESDTVRMFNAARKYIEIEFHPNDLDECTTDEEREYFSSFLDIPPSDFYKKSNLWINIPSLTNVHAVGYDLVLSEKGGLFRNHPSSITESNGMTETA